VEQEDTVLRELIAKHGARNWSVIANGIRGRSGKSCRLRWCNQLNPCVKKEPFSEEEDAMIMLVRGALLPLAPPRLRGRPKSGAQ
jgi:myb proto-oncogene protein